MASKIRKNKLYIILLICMLMVAAVFAGGCQSEENSSDINEDSGKNVGEVVQGGDSGQEQIASISFDLDKMYPDIKRVVERGELIVAVPSQDLAAFYEVDDKGELGGVDIDLARGIAQSLGVDAVFDRSAQSYAQINQRLENHEVDLVIGTYSNSLERAVSIAFSEPYLNINYGIMVNKQRLTQTEAEDNPLVYLKENSAEIAVIKETSHAHMAKELFPTCKMVEYETYDEAMESVKKGDVYGFFSVELEFISKYIYKPEMSVYTKAFSFTDIQDKFCIGVAKENTGLLNYVNIYLANKTPVSKTDIIERYLKNFEGESK